LPRKLASETKRKQREVAKATDTRGRVQASVVLPHARDLFAAAGPGRPPDDAYASEGPKTFATVISCQRRNGFRMQVISEGTGPCQGPVTQIWAVFDRGAHVEIGVRVKARAEPHHVAAGGP
jgi:hypothetical protein